MTEFEQIVSVVRSSAQKEVAVEESSTPKTVKLEAGDLLTICGELQQNPATYFDMLSCVTGVDNGPEKGTMEVIYNLYSIPLNHHLMIKVMLPREQPEIDSVTGIWKTANWHEREIFDMFGIKFRGHPDLRRILLPADWEGHPLLKDYKQQDYYHGIKVEY